MSEEELDADDKPYEATQKKLDEARKKGEIASSVDLTASAAYGGFLLAAFSLGAWALAGSVGVLSTVLEQSAALGAQLELGGGDYFSASLILATTQVTWVWLGIPLFMAVIALIAQRAFVFAPDKIIPKLSRVSPLSNAKQKFGRNGLFEFAKSFSKLSIYSVILGVFIWLNLEQIVVTVAMSPAEITMKMLRLSVAFFSIVFLVSVTIGGVDFLWQRAEHLRKHRMSHKELTDETKESEGDPWLKGERRQRGYDIATNRMLEDVPSADVIVVNPLHYAVALKWDRTMGGAPVCIAKGVDEVAGRIRAKASEAGIPIRRDPPTARALYASIDIGDEVLPEHYRPVAAAIRFAEKMRQRASKSSW